MATQSIRKSTLEQGSMFSSRRKSAPANPAQRNIATQPSQQNPNEAPPASRRGGRLVPSIISGDLIISGNLLSGGELQVDGTIDGDVRASSLVIGEQATVTGEVLAEEVIIRGRVIGSVRGLRVVLAANCHVEGEIFHESLAVEPGAYFEGNCRRSEDPLSRSEDVMIAAQQDYYAQPPEQQAPPPVPVVAAPEPQYDPREAEAYAPPAPAPDVDDYEDEASAPVVVKDGRVVVRRSAAE